MEQLPTLPATVPLFFECDTGIMKKSLLLCAGMNLGLKIVLLFMGGTINAKNRTGYGQLYQRMAGVCSVFTQALKNEDEIHIAIFVDTE